MTSRNSGTSTFVTKKGQPHAGSTVVVLPGRPGIKGSVDHAFQKIYGDDLDATNSMSKEKFNDVVNERALGQLQRELERKNTGENKWYDSLDLPKGSTEVRSYDPRITGPISEMNEVFQRAVMNALSVGNMDKALALIDVFINPKWSQKNDPFQKRYEDELAYRRAVREVDEERHPYLTAAGKIIGQVKGAPRK